MDNVSNTIGENVKFEVALEVISMYMSIAIANNDLELVEKQKIGRSTRLNSSHPK